MPGSNDSGFLTFEAGAAIGQHLRVKLTAGKLALAVAADGPGVELGTTEEASFASGDMLAVRARNVPGSRKMVANAAIAAGAEVFTAALGKVGAHANGSFSEGIALTAAAADGEIIEVLTQPASPGKQSAANPDTTGATLAVLETEVNELKAALRAAGIIAV